MKLLKFYAQWCAPCKTTSQLLEAFNNPLEVEEIDIDSKPHTAMTYRVSSVPTLILVDDNGVEVARKTGTFNKKEFEDIFLSKIED